MRRSARTRLALGVIAGTGRAGVLRTAVLIAATAVAVAATLTVLFVPAIASHRADAASARVVRQVVPGTEASFRGRALDTSVGDRTLSRIYLEAGPSAPAPPGIDSAPRPGEVYASPALSALLRSTPAIASFVPGHVVGTVTADALADPGELFAYIGVADADLPPASGFGGQGDAEGGASGLVIIQLALFVLIPSGAFLAVSATLSSRTRTRRWDAMRSASVPEGVVRHVASVETGFASIAGGVLGLALFSLVRLPLTGEGVGGLRWFASDLRLTPTIVAATLLGVAGAGTWLGRRATRIVRMDSLHAAPTPAPAGVRWVPLTSGTAVLATIGVVHGAGRIVDSAALFLGAAVIAALGLGLVLVPVVRATGTLVATRSRGITGRLGGARTAYEPRSVVRVLAGLVAITIIGYVNFAVLTDLRHVVGDQREDVVATTSIGDQSPASADRILRAGERSVAVTTTMGQGPESATIAYADCSTMGSIVELGAECRPGSVYRVADTSFPSDLTAGRTYAIATRTGTPTTVTAPDVEAVDRYGMLGTTTLLIADDPPTDRILMTEVRFLVDRARLLDLQSTVDAIDPRLLVDANIEPHQIERYDRHLAIARLGTVLGGLLATLTFLVAAIDGVLERRSHLATLSALGTPRRTLRRSQVVQLVVPLAAALAMANGVGWLIAQAYLAMGGLVPGVPVGLLGQGAVVSAALLVVACAVGAVVSIPKDIVTHLRAE